MTSPRISLVACLMAAVIGACRAPTEVSTRTQNDRARALWASARPASYDFTLSVSCFCIPDVTRQVVIIVNGASIVSRTYLDNGAPVPNQWATTFPTIDGLFDKIDSAIDANASIADVSYDPSRGFPTHIAIDYIKLAVDDEMAYTIRDFHPRVTN